VVIYWTLTVGFARVRSLALILDDINIISLSRDLTDEQEKELRSTAEGCQNVLEMLDTTLEKYQDLSSDPNDPGPTGFGFRLRRRWKRVKWEPEDVKELRSRITSNIGLLNAFYGRLTR